MLVLLVSVAQVALEERGVQQASGKITCNPNLKLRRMVQPVYPEEAQRDGIRGTVVVEVLVDRRGVPRAVHTVRGDSILASAVSQAVQQWRWKPFRLNRKVVAVETTIAVNFEPTSHAVPVY
jgi:TonB family protein